MRWQWQAACAARSGAGSQPSFLVMCRSGFLSLDLILEISIAPTPNMDCFKTDECIDYFIDYANRFVVGQTPIAQHSEFG